MAIAKEGEWRSFCEVLFGGGAPVIQGALLADNAMILEGSC